MERTKRESAITTLESLSYEDKLYVYGRIFSIGNINTNDLDDRMVLISLLALTTKKMREKDASITPLQVLMKITGQINDGSAFYQFLEALSIISEDFSYECNTISACGLKSSQEIINKIKELLSKWVPF